MRKGRGTKKGGTAKDKKVEESDPIGSDDDVPLAQAASDVETSKKESESGEEPVDPPKEDKAENSDEENYEVEKILDVRGEGKEREFKVRWKGFKADEDTWEPEENVDCKNLIKEFMDKQNETPAKKGKRGRKSKQDEGEEKEAKPAKKAKRGRKSGKTNGKQESDEEGTSDTEYEVKSILEVHTKKNGKREFLVRWKGFSAKDDTWEPEEHLNCKDLIKEFERKLAKVKEAVPRETRVGRKKSEFVYDTASKNKSKRSRGVRPNYAEDN